MPRVQRVTAQGLRQIFNEGLFYERMQAGELVEQVGYNSHPCPEWVNEPYCTRSQIVNYIDLQLGRKVAQVHQYRRTDGSLGASGKPDTKAVLRGRTIYRIEVAEPD